jgi:hypothetical protein
MALAGIWETWHSPADQRVQSFAIITRTPNELRRAAQPDAGGPGAPGLAGAVGEEPADPPRLTALLPPYAAEEMTCWPVSTRVGNVKNNDPSLIGAGGARLRIAAAALLFHAGRKMRRADPGSPGRLTDYGWFQPT